MNDWYSSYPKIAFPQKVFQIHDEETVNLSSNKKRLNNWIPKYIESGAEVITCDDWNNKFDKTSKFSYYLLEKYNIHFYVSTVNYMLAMACESDYDKVTMVGFMMLAKEEREAQLPPCRFGIRKLRETGKEVKVYHEELWNSERPDSDITELNEDNPLYIFGELRKELERNNTDGKLYKFF